MATIETSPLFERADAANRLTPEAIRLEKAMLASHMRNASNEVKVNTLQEEITVLKKVLSRKPRNWTPAMCFALAEHSSQVAYACRNVKPKLDEEFALACEKVSKKYRPDH